LPNSALEVLNEREHRRLAHYILAADVLWIPMSLTLAYVLSYGLVCNRPTQGSFLIFLPPVVVTLLLWVFLFSGMKLDCFGGGWHFPPVFSQVFCRQLFDGPAAGWELSTVSGRVLSSINRDRWCRDLLPRTLQDLGAPASSAIDEVVRVLLQTYQGHRAVFLLGNGGSAALALHLVCDLGKGTAVNGRERFRVLSLTDNVPDRMGQ